jgi:predicted dehydrogenase
MKPIIKWGIIGPGKIAQKFADALKNVEGAELYAIASRSENSAKDFANKYGALKFYGSYEQLAKDPEVDLIYVATPHAFHKEHTLLCITNKKPVLCEKPMAHKYNDVKEMITASEANKVFLMEAMWTRFLPPLEKTMELIAEGQIGKVTKVKADFGFKTSFDPKGRLFDMALGGGSLLDVGVYPLFLALTILGEPSGYEVNAKLCKTGADEDFKFFLYYPEAEAELHSSILKDTPREAVIEGTEGSIHFTSPWYRETSISIKKKNGEIRHHYFPATGNGFEPEIREAMKCVNEGKIESDRMSHRFSLMQSKVLDLLCKEGGLVYP